MWAPTSSPPREKNPVGLTPHSIGLDIFHFPDGNASIARLLVRSLIPGVASGSTMEDVVTGRFDYARLDEADSPIRIWLNSTAVKVQHLGTPDRAVSF
jgi:spermidine dehydrogenase